MMLLYWLERCVTLRKGHRCGNSKDDTLSEWQGTWLCGNKQLHQRQCFSVGRSEIEKEKKKWVRRSCNRVTDKEELTEGPTVRCGLISWVCCTARGNVWSPSSRDAGLRPWGLSCWLMWQHTWHLREKTANIHHQWFIHLFLYLHCFQPLRPTSAKYSTNRKELQG